jgi:hypothetical protein
LADARTRRKHVYGLDAAVMILIELEEVLRRDVGRMLPAPRERPQDLLLA